MPTALRFGTQEVFIRQDLRTRDVILSRKPAAEERIFSTLPAADVRHRTY